MVAGRFVVRREEPEPVEENTQEVEDAALIIQAYWRGKSIKPERTEPRHKPLGFFTHTLHLTYLHTRIGHQPAKPTWRRKLFLLMEEPRSSHSAQALALGIIVTIFASVASFVLETVPELAYDRTAGIWDALEVVCTAIFTAEYALRFLACQEAGMTRCGFLTNPMNLLDLVSILPFYIEFAFKRSGKSGGSTLDTIKVVRVLRVARVLKLGRRSAGMRLVGKALHTSSQAISVLLCLLLLGLVLFSSALYHIEKLSCPDQDSMTEVNVQEYMEDCEDPYYRGVSPRYGLCCTDDGSPKEFGSIVTASWWSIVTMTTVGYGDVMPRTIAGMCVGMLVMMVGMIVLTLPIAIIGQKFQEVYERHHMEMARFAGSARMKVAGEQWTLMPASDISSKLYWLKPKDPNLANSVTQFAKHLEGVWEQREMLMRERHLEMEKQNVAHGLVTDLLAGLEASLNH